MTALLVMGGVMGILLASAICAYDRWLIGGVVAVLAVAMVIVGLVTLVRDKDAARARCDARGGTFADLRSSDLCFAPGVVLEVSE